MVRRLSPNHTNEPHDNEPGEGGGPLGEPFALSSQELELLPPRDDAQYSYAGCVACVRCQCGSLFELDLLTIDPKTCPGCGTVYTHCLVVARADDSEIVDELLAQLDGDEVIDAEANDDDDDQGGDDDQSAPADDDDHGDDARR